MLPADFCLSLWLPDVSLEETLPPKVLDCRCSRSDAHACRWRTPPKPRSPPPPSPAARSLLRLIVIAALLAIVIVSYLRPCACTSPPAARTFVREGQPGKKPPEPGRCRCATHGLLWPCLEVRTTDSIARVHRPDHVRKPPPACASRTAFAIPDHCLHVALVVAVRPAAWQRGPAVARNPWLLRSCARAFALRLDGSRGGDRKRVNVFPTPPVVYLAARTLGVSESSRLPLSNAEPTREDLFLVSTPVLLSVSRTASCTMLSTSFTMSQTPLTRNFPLGRRRCSPDRFFPRQFTNLGATASLPPSSRIGVLANRSALIWTATADVESLIDLLNRYRRIHRLHSFPDWMPGFFRYWLRRA